MNTQERVWKIGAIVGILLAIYLIALSIAQFKSIQYIGSSVTPTNTISVTGTGEAYAIPDVATFSFSVTANAKTVTIAQSQSADKINAALKSVRDAGVQDKDIQTTSYNVSPHYEYQSAVCPTIARADGTPIYCPPGKSVMTGYDVSQTITVKIKDLTKAGDIFASIGSQKVDNINGLNFGVDDPDKVKAEARNSAIAKAKDKADIIAKQLGVSLVRIVSFSDDSNGYPSPLMYEMSSAPMMGKTASVPEIPTGQQKVTDTVSITYEIN